MRTLEGRSVVFIEDLVGMTQIAERVGVTWHAVMKWRRRNDDFPKPIANVGGAGQGSSYVWDWAQVRKWLDDHPRVGA